MSGIEAEYLSNLYAGDDGWFDDDDELYDAKEEAIEHYFQMDRLEAHYIRIQKEAESRIWQMKNGEYIKVCDMTDSHIKNTINMLKRKPNSDVYKPWIKVFNAELKRRENKE